MRTGCYSYALIVLNNHNLQDIWNFNTHPDLRILNGLVFFQQNHKLCLDKIDHFVKSVGLEHNITEIDVDRLNNGDQVACKSALSLALAR